MVLTTIDQSINFHKYCVTLRFSLRTHPFVLAWKRSNLLQRVIRLGSIIHNLLKTSKIVEHSPMLPPLVRESLMTTIQSFKPRIGKKRIMSGTLTKLSKASIEILTYRKKLKLKLWEAKLIDFLQPHRHKLNNQFQPKILDTHSLKIALTLEPML